MTLKQDLFHVLSVQLWALWTIIRLAALTPPQYLGTEVFRNLFRLSSYLYTLPLPPSPFLQWGLKIEFAYIFFYLVQWVESTGFYSFLDLFASITTTFLKSAPVASTILPSPVSPLLFHLLPVLLPSLWLPQSGTNCTGCSSYVDSIFLLTLFLLHTILIGEIFRLLVLVFYSFYFLFFVDPNYFQISSDLSGLQNP